MKNSYDHFRVEIEGGASVSAMHYAPSQQAKSETLLLLAHGAGADQHHDFMVRFARGLADRGLHVVTFNFPYMEARRKVPDPGDRLESCYRAVFLRTHRKLPECGRVLVGGKSLGGRIASQMAAKDAAISSELAGLVFLGYPLHPPGKPEQRRDRHLAKIGVPMLFIQGSRDAFGTPEELEPVRQSALSEVKLYPVEGADHSLKIPKRSGISQESLYAQIMDEIVRWAIEH